MVWHLYGSVFRDSDFVFCIFTKSKLICYPLIVLGTIWKFNTTYKRPVSFTHRKPHVSICHSFFLVSVLVSVTRTSFNYHSCSHSFLPLHTHYRFLVLDKKVKIKKLQKCDYYKKKNSLKYRSRHTHLENSKTTQIFVTRTSWLGLH